MLDDTRGDRLEGGRLRRPGSTPIAGTSSAPIWLRLTISCTTPNQTIGPAGLGEPPGRKERRSAPQRGSPHRSVRHPPADSGSAGAPPWEIEEALAGGVDDRMTRVHLEDALVRIRASIGAG